MHRSYIQMPAILRAMSILLVTMPVIQLATRHVILRVTLLATQPATQPVSAEVHTDET